MVKVASRSQLREQASVRLSCTTHAAYTYMQCKHATTHQYRSLLLRTAARPCWRGSTAQHGPQHIPGCQCAHPPPATMAFPAAEAAAAAATSYVATWPPSCTHHALPVLPHPHVLHLPLHMQQAPPPCHMPKPRALHHLPLDACQLAGMRSHTQVHHHDTQHAPLCPHCHCYSLRGCCWLVRPPRVVPTPCTAATYPTAQKLHEGPAPT